MKEGEEVEQFQNLADVATDKLFTQIPAVENGKIHKLHVKEGQACQVGSILLELEVEEESAADQPAATKTKPAPSSGAAPVQKAQSNTSTPARSTSEGDKVLSTPAVREYAKLKGVEISAIQVVLTLIRELERMVGLPAKMLTPSWLEVQQAHLKEVIP